MGGSGFLGRHITSALQASGQEVITLGRSRSADVLCDATQTDRLASILKDTKPSTVVNLLGAGLADPNADGAVMNAVNTQIPAHLPELMAIAVPGTRLIHAASSTETPAADGTYESAYSRSKALGTKGLWESDVELAVTILRVHNTYGADQPARRFVASVIDSLAAGHKVFLRYPERVRDFVHVNDVSAAFVAAVNDRAKTCVTYEVGTGIGTSLISVVRIIAEILGVDEPQATGDSHNDRHPQCVASLDALLLPATIHLRYGLEMTIAQRLKESEIA